MTQRLPEFGPIFEPSVVAPAIGVGEHAIRATGLPIQQVSCGVPFVIVPLDTRASVDAATVYSRMFAPGLGVFEDPATGSASGPLGCYLVHHSVIAPDKAGSIVNLQGVKLGTMDVED